MSKLSVCILFGGMSPEHEVSLRSAEAVLNHIDHEKYNVFPVGITKDGDWIIYGGKDHATYKETSIETLSVDSLRSRNEMKTNAARALSGLSQVEKIPYAFYYFSRNIEHVLHNRADNLSSREKRLCSEAFENAYADHPEEFVQFMRSREVAVRGGYSKTWEYILRGTNSLKRGSNFGLFFDWNPKIE